MEKEFTLNFCDITTDYICLDNMYYYNKDITEEQIIKHIKELQNKITENSKYILDSLTYSAVKHLAEDEYHIYHACEIGIIEGERDEVLSSERIQELDDYAKSINLNIDYKGYKGDMTTYIYTNFPELDLDLIVTDYDLFEGIMLSGDGGLSYTPDGDTDVWEGDYIEIDCNLTVTICGH